MSIIISLILTVRAVNLSKICQMLSYYYEKYGNITIADFFTYLQDKKELLDTLNIILSFDYTDDIRKDLRDSDYSFIEWEIDTNKKRKVKIRL